MPLALVQYPLPHFDSRPKDENVDTVVIHCMYDASGLFPYDAPACMKLLDSNKVSPHYSICRLGSIFQSVDESLRAWHAGKSLLPEKGQEKVNDFSIGIELIGMPSGSFTNPQYEALIALISDIRARHPIRFVVGHEHIAPIRKVDPGPTFDWKRLAKAFPSLQIPQAKSV